MNFDLALLAGFLPQILRGVGVTLLLWLACCALGLMTGFAIAVARRYGPPIVNLVFYVPVEIIRGTPFLVQVFLLYYGGPVRSGSRLDNLPAGDPGVVDLRRAPTIPSCWRAGFEAIPQGHIEAADCVGLTTAQTRAPHHPAGDGHAGPAGDGEHDHPHAEGDRHPFRSSRSPSSP